MLNLYTFQFGLPAGNSTRLSLCFIWPQPPPPSPAAPGAMVLGPTPLPHRAHRCGLLPKDRGDGGKLFPFRFILFHSISARLRWEGALGLCSPLPAHEGRPKQGALPRVQVASEGLQGDPTASGYLCLCSSTCTAQQFFSCSEGLPVFHFVPSASCPSTGHHWKEPGSNPAAPSFKYLYACMGSPQAVLSPGWRALALSAFPRDRGAPFPYHLHGPSLDFFWCVQISLMLGSPELDPALQMRHHQYWVNYIPPSAVLFQWKCDANLPVITAWPGKSVSHFSKGFSEISLLSRTLGLLWITNWQPVCAHLAQLFIACKDVSVESDTNQRQIHPIHNSLDCTNFSCSI